MSRHNRVRRRDSVRAQRAFLAEPAGVKREREARSAAETARRYPPPPAYRDAPPSKARKVRRGDLFPPLFVFGGFKGASFR